MSDIDEYIDSGRNINTQKKTEHSVIVYNYSSKNSENSGHNNVSSVLKYSVVTGEDQKKSMALMKPAMCLGTLRK